MLSILSHLSGLLTSFQDITPRQIAVWLQQPVERIHVLLDNKGKTLSHAYIEVKDSSIAGAILRGETVQPNPQGRRERGTVLGKGKRARGVTITRSTQEELMANVRSPAFTHH